MAKPKKPTKKQGKKPRKAVQVKDLKASGSLAQKIKGGAVPTYIYFPPTKSS